MIEKHEIYRKRNQIEEISESFDQKTRQIIRTYKIEIKISVKVDFALRVIQSKNKMNQIGNRSIG